MLGSWTLDAFIVGSVILFLVPLIACIRDMGKK
jgi:hypothetical protein